jgi:RecG-like helicase
VVSLTSLIENLARPPEEIRAQNLREWASTIPNAVPIADLEPRKSCTVAGVVQNIRIDPREGRGSIEATIIDGSGRLVVRWLGRSSLSGVKLGVGLVVTGTVGQSSESEPMVMNPEYELIPGPEHG